MSNFPQPIKIHGSSVISAYPLDSGVGTYSKRLFSLGLYEELVMFKIIGSYSEKGFDKIIKYNFNPKGLFTFVSLYAGSRWGSYVASRSFVHFSSPDWFHLSKYCKNSYGTVHDVFPVTHSEWFSKYYAFYFKKEMVSAEKLKGIVAVSKATQKSISENFPHLKTTVIHNWTGNEFHYRDKIESRIKLNLPLDKKIVLSVGSDIPRKNTKILPDIIGRLGKDYLLLRLGSFAFSSKKHLLKELINSKRLLLINNVRADLVPLYYNSADVLITPSIAEGFDYPVIEAINSNIPVVASDIEVHREIMMNKGHFVDPYNPDLWAEEIMKAAEELNPWSGFGDHYRESRALKEYLKLYGIS